MRHVLTFMSLRSWVRSPRNFVAVTRSNVLGLMTAAPLLLIASTGWVHSAEWTVTIRLHEAEALTNSDTWGEQDMYWNVSMSPINGSGANVDCSTEESPHDDDNKIDAHDNLGWACTMKVTGDPNTSVRIKLELWDYDSTSGNDELDLNPDHNQLGLEMQFEPRSSKLSIVGIPEWATGKCATGNVAISGFGGGGDEPAEVTFSVSASPALAIDGDTDGDGLLDTWEQCGLPSVDLPAMGANPFRKDIFAEIDWMVAPSGTDPHTHAPWLPALINAWNEMNIVPVTNPTVSGVTQPSGIALHIDTGLLYANYSINFDGSGSPEISIGATGNLDLNNDSIPDIGNLAGLGTGTAGGGNMLAEVTSLAPATSGGTDFMAPGSSFAAIKSANFAATRSPVFHYALFGHSYPSENFPNGTPGSSGFALGSSNAASDLMVTLGLSPAAGAVAFGREFVDTNGNGVRNPTEPFIPGPGPGGLPTDGLFRHHVGTFLHELGHNLFLDHGGADAINYKPNYLSIMNYAWQMRGIFTDTDNDLLADDTVGVDFNQDNRQDVSRFQYSSKELNELNEGVGPTPHLNETVPIDPGSASFAQFTCPPRLVFPPRVIMIRGDQRPNWNCRLPANEAVSSNINNVRNTSPGLERLNGFDDTGRLANGGLDFSNIAAGGPGTGGPGISAVEEQELDSTRQRMVQPPQRREIVNRCTRPRQIAFEEFPAGTRISANYGPLVTFLSDDRRSPVIAAPTDRNNVPTGSAPQSLLNEARRGGAPLVMSFDPPQRLVKLEYGQAGLSGTPSERTRAVLQGFDENDLPLGEIEQTIPPPSEGITEAFIAAAVFPDQLIRRLELRYEVGVVSGRDITWMLSPEPVQIDDLVACEQLEASGVHPVHTPPPVFGEHEVDLQIDSELLLRVPSSTPNEPGYLVTLRNPFTGLPVTVDGSTSTTSLKLTRAEGTSITISAPLNYSGARFLHWRHSSGVSLGEGINIIPVTLLRDGALTAVYRGREQAPVRPPLEPTEKRLRDIGRCVDQCFRSPGGGSP